MVGVGVAVELVVTSVVVGKPKLKVLTDELPVAVPGIETAIDEA